MRFEMKKTVFILAVSLLLSPQVFAQTLEFASGEVVVDGTAGPSEYPGSDLLKGIRLFYALSPDRSVLYLTITAPTTGWVALAPGSSRMHGAFMILGYHDGRGPVVREDTGWLWFHSPNKENLALAASVQEMDGQTSLEVALPAARWLEKPELEVMVSFGPQDNFNDKHLDYGVIRLQVPTLP